MNKIRSTKEVARLLGIPVAGLAKAIYRDRIEAPGKGPGNAFQWGREDILRAGWALLRRDVSGLLDAETQGDGHPAYPAAPAGGVTTPAKAGEGAGKGAGVDLGELHDRAVADKSYKGQIDVAPIEGRTAERIQSEAGFTLAGGKWILDADHVRHILNRHEADSLPIQRDDLLRLPEILSGFDTAKRSGNAGWPKLPGLLITKRINGTVYVVGAVAEGKGEVRIKTMYKKTAGDIDRPGVQQTSETFPPEGGMLGATGRPTSSTTDIIDATRPKVKRPVANPPEAEPWRMTKEQNRQAWLRMKNEGRFDNDPMYQAQMGYGVSDSADEHHWQEVFRAVRAGKPVPREVLQDYADQPWAKAALAKLDAGKEADA